jgi:periplasmic protein TonB
MEINKILSADILDIIFEGKNKEYGAYELRKTYNHRLRNALLITLSLFIILLLANIVAANINTAPVQKELNVKDLTLENAPKEPPPPPPPPPPKLPPPPPIATVQFTPPKIVKDQEVIKPPVENKELEDKKVDVKNEEGEKDKGIVAPPIKEEGTKIIEAPADDNQIFTKVEVDAAFPGGDAAWTRYVTKAIQNNIDDLTEAGDQGTCTVRFIVDKNGNVSDVVAETMKGTKLAEVAVQAIKKGPKWVPAIQNGRNVNAYRYQPVTFKMSE